MGKKQRKSKRNNNNNNNHNKKLDWPVGLVTIPNSVHGVANAVRVKLVYQESGVTTALSGYSTYRANDLFDPFATSSGFTLSGNQQPQFSDVWKQMYNKYRVLSSTISVRIINAATNPIPIFIEVSPEDQLVTSSNAPQASVARFASSRIYPNGPSTPSVNITRSMSTARINGVSENTVLIDDSYQAAFNTSPADPWYWQIRYSAVDFTTTALVWMFIHMTFDVVLQDPVQDDDND